MNKSIFAVIFILFNYCMALTMPFDMKINLKNQTTLRTSVINVDSLGFTLVDGRVIIYKVVQTIHTDNAALVDEIKNLFQDIEILQTKEGYIIDCSNIPIHLKKPLENIFFQQEYLMLTFMSNKAENFEFQLNVVPEFCDYVVGQMAYSFGWSHLENTHNISAYSIGLGGQLIVSDFNYLVMINLARKVNMLTNSEGNTFAAIQKNSLYATLSAQYFNPNNKFIYSIGMRYYIKNIPVGEKKTSIAMNLGCGIKF